MSEGSILELLPTQLRCFSFPRTVSRHAYLARYVTMVYFTAVMTQENVRALVIFLSQWFSRNFVWIAAAK